MAGRCVAVARDDSAAEADLVYIIKTNISRFSILFQHGVRPHIGSSTGVLVVSINMLTASFAH